MLTIANKKAKVSMMFIVVLIVSLGIWIYFKDFRTAALVFLGYAAIRIIANFLKREPKSYEYEQ